MNKQQVRKMYAKLTKRVRLGIAYLDKEMPGWEWKIDTDRLNLNDETSCVLGQAYENFWRKILTEEHGTDDGEENRLSLSQAMRRGFYVFERESDLDYYTYLTYIWSDLIKKLKAKRLKVRV